MTLKVTKKGKSYAVVKETIDHGYWMDEYWYVVDVASGTKIKKSYAASDAKWYLDSLEDGYSTPEDYHTSWNSSFGEPIDMPDSLKKMQKQLLNPTPNKQTSQKPIGSTSANIVETIDNGTHYILKMDDGTFGVLVPSTGESKMGLKSLGGAKTSAKSMLKKMAGQKLGDMGVDAGSDAVDTLLKVYDDRMRDMYGQAAREMAEKQAKFMEEFAKRQQKMVKSLADGDITMSQYKTWLRSQDATQQWYREMVESLSNDLVEADQNAMRILNGYVPTAYAENFNFGTFQIEQSASVSTSFSLYNESTVARLIANPEGSLLPELPQPETDKLKDKAWSKQKISSAVTQSILQGESVPEAAKRLQAVVGMSANSAMRAARTTLTAAQNLGRLDSGRRAKKMGISLKKQWVATVDSRTRYAHREIDRETVELEEDFSNGCDCPGHLNSGSDAGQVYNCRCAMRYVIPGHEYDDLPSRTREGVDYEEWKNEHLTKLQAQKDNIQAQLDDANAHISDLKKLLPADQDFSSKFNTNIIHGSSKVSDWSEDAVSKSEDFFFGKLKDAIANNNQYDIDWYKKRLAQLKEYDDAGRAYAEAQKAIGPQIARWQSKADEAKKKLKKIGVKPNANAYTEERRNAVKFFSTPRQADNALRGWTGDVWRTSKVSDKKAINTYTGGAYYHYNRPLNGYANGSYSMSSYRGAGNVDLDEEGYGNEIRHMTDYLRGSITEQDMWLRHGGGATTVSQMLGLPAGTNITDLSEPEIRSYIGMSGRMGMFVSCGTTADTGFTKSSQLEIFVPAGSQAAYVEPFSRCGEGAGMSWDGISPQHSLGTELETILQRGGSYTLIDYKVDGGIPTFVLEVHPEDGYWTFGQD